MKQGGENIRVWRVKKDSPAAIVISENEVILQGDKHSFISIEPGAIGNTSNKVNFQAAPENISKGIFFKENMGFLQTIPSSTVTPIPNLIWNVPGAGLLKNISQGPQAIACLNLLQG